MFLHRSQIVLRLIDATLPAAVLSRAGIQPTVLSFSVCRADFIDSKYEAVAAVLSVEA